jgi:hypothetical protein
LSPFQVRVEIAFVRLASQRQDETLDAYLKFSRQLIVDR